MMAGSARMVVALLCCLGVGAIGASSAAAVEIPPPPFTQFPEAPAAAGSQAGQIDQPVGIASNPVNKHIYVAETNNRRISEFTAWGEFVKAFGWGVAGGDELQTCTVASGCEAGSTGSRPGEFGEVPETSHLVGPTGIAVDSTGAIYAMDVGNMRVQKFSAAGEFILTFGGKVNEDTGGNVCTKASGDTCVAGEVGVGPGEFSIENAAGVRRDFLAVGPDDTVYVGDKDRIQAFNPDGTFKAEIELPEPGNPGALEVGPDGTIYFAYNQPFGFTISPQPNVYRFTPGGEQIFPSLPASKPQAIAVGPEGNVFVANHPATEVARVVIFDPAGNKLGEFGGLVGNTTEMAGVAVGGVGEDDEDIDIYVPQYDGSTAAIKAYGAIPDPDVVGVPPAVPPVIAEQFAASVGADSATLKARINPKFWTDTTFQLEYGGADCATISCAKVPASPLLLTSKVVSEPVLGPGVAISGLEPDTTYHYRFVAQSGGGGPVLGPDRTFTTTATAARPVAACPANDVFRIGAGAFLPDCRAYEMVSPVDKLNANVVTLPNGRGFPTALNKSAAAGGRFTYSAAKAYGEVQSSPYSSQYLAVRDAGSGWQGKSISPPRQGPTLLQLTGLEVQFKLFDEALCGAYFLQDTALSLSPQAVPGYADLYREDLCAGGAYDPIIQVKPASQDPAGFRFEIQGAGGGHTVFRANDSLIEGVAPAGPAAKVYDYSDGGISYVCVLPNGTPVASGCSVGAAGNGVVLSERSGQVKNAVSADGNRIYWTASEANLGKLYLREGGVKTIAVSKAAAQFWGASASGNRVIFAEGANCGAEPALGTRICNLYSFEPEEDLAESGVLIAGGVLGVAGMSEDAKVVYFVSTESLAGGATTGQPNLYRFQAGGSPEFIATLSSSDVTSERSTIALRSSGHAAKASASGNVLAFISDNELTGLDSHDLKSGKPDTQVYLYDADSAKLQCVSCNETGVRPAGRDIIPGVLEFWAAGLLPTPANQLYYPRVLSADGKRLYFDSFDSLVMRDTNGAMDVYQWEAQGKGDCTEDGGCVRLISSGKNPSDSEFVDASADGTDVFFSTASSLVAQDPGLIDVYDARVGGGFPPPPAEDPGCIGEACQSPAPAPNDPTPPSAVPGRGNATEEPMPKRCPKGKHRAKNKNGKTVCVKPKRCPKGKHKAKNKNGKTVCVKNKPCPKGKHRAKNKSGKAVCVKNQKMSKSKASKHGRTGR